MGADAEFQTRATNSRNIRRVQILLPQMDEIATRIDGEPPVVVDDELCAGGGAKIARGGDFTPQNRFVIRFDPQLRQPQTAGQQPPQPVHAIHNEIKTIEHFRLSNRDPAAFGFQPGGAAGFGEFAHA